MGGALRPLRISQECCWFPRNPSNNRCWRATIWAFRGWPWSALNEGRAPLFGSQFGHTWNQGDKIVRFRGLSPQLTERPVWRAKQACENSDGVFGVWPGACPKCRSVY